MRLYLASCVFVLTLAVGQVLIFFSSGETYLALEDLATCCLHTAAEKNWEKIN